MLLLWAKVSDFGGLLCSLMWKWDVKKTHAIWKEGFIGNMDQLRPHQTDKVICLICKQVTSVLKEFNVQHHYENNHKSSDRFMGFPCGPQSYAGSINCLSVIKTLRSLWDSEYTTTLETISLKQLCTDYVSFILPLVTEEKIKVKVSVLFYKKYFKLMLGRTFQTFLCVTKQSRINVGNCRLSAVQRASHVRAELLTVQCVLSLWNMRLHVATISGC